MSICTRGESLAYLGLGSAVSDQDLGLLNLLQPIAERLVKNHVGYEIEQATFTEYYPDRGLYTPLDFLIEGYEGASGRAVPIERFRSDNRLISLRQLPARTITTVYEDPGAWDTAVGGVPVYAPKSQLFEGSDWQLDTRDPQISWTGFLFRRTGVWSNVERAIQVVYVGGFTPAELQTTYPQFKAAVLMTVSKWFREAKAQSPNQPTGATAGAVVMERLDDYQVGLDPKSQAANLGLQYDLPIGAMRLLEKYVRYSRFL